MNKEFIEYLEKLDLHHVNLLKALETIKSELSISFYRAEREAINREIAIINKVRDNYKQTHIRG